MYKVLVVDDEPTVREGMRGIIAWEDYGFEVAGVAKDGHSALEKYREIRPDLVISDIRMTGMGGLELLKELKKIDHTIQCLILSGYADFNYAKKAIQSNAAGYLLKPIDEGELIDYLEKIKMELEKQKEVTQLTVNEVERQRELFIQSILDKKLYDEKEIVSLAKQFKLDWCKYEVLLIRITETEERKSSLLSLKNELKRIVRTDQKGIVFVSEPYLGILIKSTMHSKKERQLLFQQIKEVMVSDNETFTASLGKSVDKMTDLHVSYKKAAQLIQKRFFFPEGDLLIEGNEIIQKSNDKHIEMNEIIDKLYFALDIGISDTIEATITEIVHTADDIYSEEEVKKSYLYVLTTVFNKLQKAKPEKEVYISTLTERVLAVFHKQNIIELQNFANDVVRDAFNELEYSADTDDQIKRLLVLIDNRYSENLKLEKLADLLNYNSAYLGKLFKRYTGEYFNTYLDKVRMENAKQLLIQGLKVYRVAEIVGYSNVDYFHSKFKKYVGVSPSAFRRNNQKSI